jgi:hypothetical protein
LQNIITTNIDKIHLIPSLEEDGPKDKDNNKGMGKSKGKGKGKMRKQGRRFYFNAIVKALSLKVQQRHMDEQLCLKYHKPGHRMSKCLEQQGESSNKTDKQD